MISQDELYRKEERNITEQLRQDLTNQPIVKAGKSGHLTNQPIVKAGKSGHLTNQPIVKAGKSGPIVMNHLVSLNLKHKQIRTDAMRARKSDFIVTTHNRRYNERTVTK